ncbi:MAG: POTRA domain-containing protein [Candidatus Acidiferrales bacterium]
MQYPGTMCPVPFRFIIVTFLAAAMAGPLLPQAPAQQSTPEATAKLTAITVTGTKRYPSDQIAAVSGLTIGQQVGRDDMQAAADKLAELGAFSQVNYRFKSSPAGVALEFVVVDAPTVPVEFDNIPWFTDDELTAALKSAVGLFDGTAPQDGTILDQMTAALEALLPSRGVHAVVDRDLIQDPLSDGKMIEFHVEGDSVNVASIQFGDPAASADVHVHQSLADIIGKPYSRMTIELFELEQVRPVYLSTGHLRVQFAAPVVKFQGDPNGPSPAQVTVTLPIDPGAVYRWGGAQWSGNTVMDAAALNAMISLKPSDIADGMQIAAGWDKVEQAYGRQGRLDAKVTPQEAIDDASAVVTYKVAIDEGPLYRMGDLVITGLSLDGESRVRAAFHLSPAQIFDSVYVDQFIAELQKPTPEIFGDLPVHYSECGHWVRPNTSTHMADVLLDFR